MTREVFKDKLKGAWVTQTVGVTFGLPIEFKYNSTIKDVIIWHKENPDDWKATWYKTNKKWSEDIGSPLGVFQPFNIDAKINAAWVGPFYGDGDFIRTYEIST
jgi:hypothetical protein